MRLGTRTAAVIALLTAALSTAVTLNHALAQPAGSASLLDDDVRRTQACSHGCELGEASPLARRTSAQSAPTPATAVDPALWAYAALFGPVFIDWRTAPLGAYGWPLWDADTGATRNSEPHDAHGAPEPRQPPTLGDQD